MTCRHVKCLPSAVLRSSKDWKRIIAQFPQQLIEDLTAIAWAISNIALMAKRLLQPKTQVEASNTGWQAIGAYRNYKCTRRRVGDHLKEVSSSGVIVFCLPEGLEVVEKKQCWGRLFKRKTHGSQQVLPGIRRYINSLQNAGCEYISGGGSVTYNEESSIAVPGEDSFVSYEMQCGRIVPHPPSA